MAAHDLPHLSAEDITAEILRSDDRTIVTEWVNSILSKLTVNKANSPKSLKEPIKAALKSLVTQTLADEETPIESLELPHHVSLAEFVRRKLARRSGQSGDHALPRSEEAALSQFTSRRKQKFGSFDATGFRSKHEALWFTEFGTTVRQALCFGRARRTLSFAHLESPGPARYDPETTSLHRTPAAVVPI